MLHNWSILAQGTIGPSFWEMQGTKKPAVSTEWPVFPGQWRTKAKANVWPFPAVSGGLAGWLGRPPGVLTLLGHSPLCGRRLSSEVTQLREMTRFGDILVQI